MKRKFYVTDGPLKITGEAGGGGEFPPKNWCEGNSSEQKNPASSGTEKKNSCGGRKKNHADKSAEKKKTNKIRAPKKLHPPSGYFYFALLNYHMAVMTEVFLLAPIRSQNDSYRLELVRQNSVPYSIHFLDAIFFRAFTVSLSSLALRGWLIICRRGMLSLFILWLLRPLVRFFQICQKWRKLHLSVDTMTSL